MKRYDSSHPLISLHVPKCAGSSLILVLHKWFRGRLFSHYFDEMNGTMPARHQPKPGTCIHGHFHAYRGFGVQDYYPEIDQFITLLRDPLEQAISDYFFLKRTYKVRHSYDIKKEFGSLDTWLMNSKSKMLPYLPFHKSSRQVMTMDATNYRDIINKYYIYIGIVEDLQTSLQNLATCLGKSPFSEIPRENASSRDEGASEKAKEVFRDRNRFEYEIYDYVVDIYNNRKLLRRPKLTHRERLERLLYSNQLRQTKQLARLRTKIRGNYLGPTSWKQVTLFLERRKWK